MKEPDKLLDAEGYPTDEWLNFIKRYEPSDYIPIMDFVEMLRDRWHWSERNFDLKQKYEGHRRLILHTGGWSGNEEIINAMLANKRLMFHMQYYMWRAGGHHYFKIKTT